MTYNIRYNNAGDGINQWTNRKQKVTEVISKFNPDIFGVQEALKDQVDDLSNQFTDFDVESVGRDDGHKAGEHSAIFFNKKKFLIMDGKTFWLSPTPDSAGSVGWDAAITRICTWVMLKEISSEKIFFVFNTHFDHMGTVAREKSAELIKSKAIEIAGDFPLFIMGDFNSEPDETPYKIMTSAEPFQLFDTYFSARENKAGAICTFTGFEVNGKICKRIDYIFTDKNFSVSDYFIFHDNDGTYFPSDHLPVAAIVNLLGK